MIENTENQISFLYKNSSGNWETLSNDSASGFNGFVSGLEALENTAQVIQADLRLINVDIPEHVKMFYVSFDFSEAYSKNFELDVTYDNFNAQMKNDLPVSIAVGLPSSFSEPTNQTPLATDFFSIELAQPIGIIFCKDVNLLQDLVSNAAIRTKFKIYSYFPEKNEFIPIRVEIRLPNFVNSIKPKPFALRYPTNLNEIYESYGELQKLYLNENEQYFLNLFTTSRKNLLYSGSYVSINSGTKEIEIDFSTYSLVYNAVDSYKKSPTELVKIKTLDHIFSTEGYSTSVFNLPNKILINFNNVDTPVYTYTNPIAKEFYKVFWDIQAYFKYVVNLPSGFDSHLNKLDNLLQTIKDNLAEAKTLYDYTTSSDDLLNNTQRFFLSFTTREFIKILDGVSHILDNTVPLFTNKPDYENLSFHLTCNNCFSVYYPELSIGESIDINDVFTNSVEYLTTYLLMVSFVDYLKILFNINDNSVIGIHFNSIKDNSLKVIDIIRRQMRHAKLFDVTLITEDNNSLLINPNSLKFNAFNLIMMQSMLAERGSFGNQFWHMVNKHFRKNGVPFLPIPILTNSIFSTSLINVDLPNPLFLQILRDIDIIALILYMYANNLTYKETSSSISLKLTVTSEV